MASSNKRRLAGIITVAGICAYLGVINWVSDPAPSSAQTGPTPPVVSIVFVIDSSQSMFPVLGANYFDLAREGIAEFLELPGFDTNTYYEIAVIQYAEIGAPGYQENVHWIAPTQITNDVDRDDLVGLVRLIEPTEHFSASMMEIGISEAGNLIANSPTADADTGKHIILLGTGEYRLPPPCPPDCFTRPDDCPVEGWGCDDQSTAECQDSGETVFCNRACHIRYFVDQARSQARISTVHLGSDWHHDGILCREEPAPYWTSQNGINYCPSNTSDLPSQPDRAGFLTEIATCCAGTTDNVRVACTDDDLGKHGRVDPYLCFGTGNDDCKPGSPSDVAKVVSSWLCEWDGNDSGDLDVDGIGDGVPNLCDNCPYTINPRQRDCDGNGMGDVCQLGTAACNYVNTDSDNDGLCNNLDRCEGGDDCLVLEWTKDLGCDPTADPNLCGCDCDHDTFSDPCQAAQELAPDTLPYNDPGIDIDPEDGIPDCCVTGLCQCNEFPAVCDVAEMNVYLEYFNGLTVGAAMPQLDEEVGWWTDTPAAYDAIQIVNDGANFLQLGVSQDSSLMQDGTTPWSIEGPGLNLPEPRCLTSSCTTPSLSRWGAYNIELDLQIMGESDGPTYDLFIMDTCEDNEAQAQRVHIRFTIEPTSDPNVQIGKIWAENAVHCTGEQSSDFLVHIADYIPSEQFKLTLLFNLAKQYNKVCEWNGYGAEPVKIQAPIMNCNSALAEASFGKPYVARGVQLVITTDNKATANPLSNLFQFRRMKVYESNQCEWKNNGTKCPDGPAACDTTTCQCAWSGSGNSWKCEDNGCCGNGSLDENEQCEPPGGYYCSEFCQWRCGDGYRQASNGIYHGGYGDILISDNYTTACQDLFGLTHCTAGQETCEPPGTHELLGDCGFRICTDSCQQLVRDPDHCCTLISCLCEDFECDLAIEPVCGDGCLCRTYAPPPYGTCIPTEEPCCFEGFVVIDGESYPCEECEIGMVDCSSFCRIIAR